MPGYLTNRYIKLLPASQEDLVETQADLSALGNRVTEAEANIDDLSLNIGV